MSIMHNLKAMIKRSPLYPFLRGLRNLKNNRAQAEAHTILHNENSLFYSLSPMGLIAIVKAFNLQRSIVRGGERNLLEGYGYYEFGLFKGFSLWFAEQVSRDYRGRDFCFYGFDSFEGLPKSQVDIDPVFWAEGNYAASLEFVTAKLKEHGTDLQRVKLYKGWFSKTLFDSLRQDERFLPVSICVIDSDLFESCVEVLNFIKDLLVPGSILLFDDYNAFNKDDSHGEIRALLEFEQKNSSFRKEHLFDFGWHGVAFRVTAV